MRKPGANSITRSRALISHADFHNLRTLANNFGQDRQAMKLGNFTGIPGIPNQDIAMWETMGRIADRTKDWLGTSDIAVARFRRLMVDAAKAMRDGGPALGTTEPHIPHAADRFVRGRGAKDHRLAHAGAGRGAGADDGGGVIRGC